jgi:gliding motility-associated-like protein
VKINKDMKTYKDVSELYREKFSEYAPQPPAEVWQRIESSISPKRLSVKGKTAIVAATVAVAVTATYFGVNRTNMMENGLENQYEELLVAENSPSQTVAFAEAPPVLAQKQPLAETPKGEAVIVSSCMDVEDEDFTKPDVPTPNNLFSEAGNNTAAVSSAAQKMEKETVEEKPKRRAERPIENTTEEARQTPLPMEDSKDATEDENTVAELYIPNAFTPNGDGRNDVFAAKSVEEYSFFEMTIYSRDGRQILFISKNIKQGWDGTYRNVPQPHGMYKYTIRYKDSTGKTDIINGEVLLILD